MMLHRIGRNGHNHILLSHGCASRISIANMPLASRRNFKTSGMSGEWSKEKRSEMIWRFQQRGRPMDFDNPLTWIGLITPMITIVYCMYKVHSFSIEKSIGEEAHEKEVIRAITHRDPKLKVK